MQNIKFINFEMLIFNFSFYNDYCLLILSLTIETKASSSEGLTTIKSNIDIPFVFKISLIVFSPSRESSTRT